MVRKKKAAEPQGNEELFLALGLLEKEKGIPMDFMLDKIKKAIGTACKNTYNNEDVEMDVDPATGRFEVYLQKTVVEEIEDPDKEMLLEAAREISPMAEIGGTVGIKLDTKQFGRVAAQTARNIIRQGIRDIERRSFCHVLNSRAMAIRYSQENDLDIDPAHRQGRGGAAQDRADRRGERSGGGLHKGVCSRRSGRIKGAEGHYLKDKAGACEADV